MVELERRDEPKECQIMLTRARSEARATVGGNTARQSSQPQRSWRVRSNAALDRLVRPRIQLGRRSVAAFHACGAIGLLLAIGLSQALVAARGLSSSVMALITVAALLTIYALALLTRLISGSEQLVFYQHAVAVLLVTAALLWLLDQPLLAYLDVTMLSVGLFQSCGRIGCLLVGCCHGRPQRWGVCYTSADRAPGCTPHYLGVRLVPVQALEALLIGGCVAVGCALVLRGDQPGTALASFVVLSGIVRCGLEWLRGDPARRWLGGFSEAQWTALLLLVLVAVVEWRGLLPWQLWHTLAALVLAALLLGVAVWRRRDPARPDQLRQPPHIAEIATIIAEIDAARPLAEGTIALGTTSLGLRISGGTLASDAEPLLHYALSYGDRVLSATAARTLATIIAVWHPHSAIEHITRGSILHLVIRPSHDADDPGRSRRQA